MRWNDLDEKTVVERAGPLRAKIDVNIALASPDEAPCHVTVRMSGSRVAAEGTNAGGATVQLAPANVKLAAGGRTVRVEITTADLVRDGAIPPARRDGVGEYMTLDYVKTNPPGSNQNDSERFEARSLALGHVQRGKARTTENGPDGLLHDRPHGRNADVLVLRDHVGRPLQHDPELQLDEQDSAMVTRLLRAGVIALMVLTEAAHAQTSADLDIPIPAAPTRTAASDASLRAICMRIGARIQEAAVADDETDDRVLGKRQEEVAGAAIRELAAFARAHSGAVAAADAKLLLCFLAGGTVATREHALRWRAELGRELGGSWRALAVAMLEAEDVLSGRARPELGPADRRRIAIELGRANLATAAQVEPPEEADQEIRDHC